VAISILSEISQYFRGLKLNHWELLGIKTYPYTERGFIMNVIEYLTKKPKSFLIALGFVQVILVTVLDYLTGPHLAFSIFYLFPILLVVIILGRKGGIAISIISVIAWFVIDILTTNFAIHPFIRLWNAVVGLNFFLIITYLVSALIQEHEKEKELMQFIIHDLRSPLSNIMMGLEALESMFEKEINATEKSLIRISLSSGNWMLTLINALLDLSRLEKGKFQLQKSDVPIKDLIEMSFHQVSLWAEHKEIKLISQINADISTLNIDRELTSRVLVNLLGNAIKFSPPEKNVTIRVDSKDNKNVIFSVLDEGSGVPMEWADKVFDKFAQVDSGKGIPVTGSGLGLTFCRMSVEAQGGKIWIESNPTGGTSVKFTVPITP